MNWLGWLSALPLTSGGLSFTYYVIAFILALLVLAAGIGAWWIRTDAGSQTVDSERLLNAFDEPVAVLDPEDDVLLANVPFRTIFDSDVEGKAAADVFEAHDDLATAVADKAEITTELQTDGESRTYQLHLYPMGAQPRPPRNWVVVLHDVTEHEVREAELEAENEQLEQFASLISHDLRNPLDVAIGRTNAIREMTDDSDLDAHLARTQDAHERMQHIITDVLTLARDGHEIDELEAVPLETAAMDAWSHVDTDDATMDVDTQLVIEANEQRLVRVLENLFRNAVQHGGDDAAIVIGELADGSGFFVADDGPGIDPSEREAIFEAGHTARGDGTGLGLAIVAGIAEGHGWSVSVTESADGGARFEFAGVETAPDGRTATTVE
jgi:signal transduction histidine kinase